MQDTYILKQIDISVEEILEQRGRDLNPGTKIMVKDARPETLETVETKINIKMINRLRPQLYHFAGFLSRDTRIGGYFYPDTCEIEGFLAEDMSRVFGLPILFSTIGRHPRDHRKMSEIIVPSGGSKNFNFTRSHMNKIVVPFPDSPTYA